jgi:uncharacterized protein (DUF433 family)
MVGVCAPGSQVFFLLRRPARPLWVKRPAGEPVFPKSRLAVRQVGTMLLRGAAPADIREDYSYLTEQDIEFAKLFALAYPRVGRPREAGQAPAR